MSARSTARRAGRRALLGAALGTALLASGALRPTEARAENAWIKDEIRLNLRTGPGTEFRILAAMKTGDSVRVLERRDGWTQVRAGEHEGWIPEGYLQPAPPARLQVGELASEVETLRAKMGELAREAGSLRQTNAALSSREARHRSEMERLASENLAFRAGARWPHWFAGSAILTMGMLLGILVRSYAGRSKTRRVRL